MDLNGNSIANNLSLSGTGVSSAGALTNSAATAVTESGTVTLAANTTIGGNSDLTLSGVLSGAYGLALTNAGAFTATNTSNNISSLAATGVTSLDFVNSNALSIGTVNAQAGVSATGTVSIATLTGDLTVSQNISTTNSSANAVLLNAGKNTLAGLSTGGNIVVSGSPTVSTGAGGRAVLMTGSIANSTGVTALVGSGSGNFRYNSSANSVGYDSTNAPLGSGVYAVYRESPTLNITATNASKTYDGVAYSGGNGASTTGWVNGDTSASLSGTLSYGGAAQGSRNAGNFALSTSGLSSKLGYTVNYIDGTLAVAQKAVTLTVGNVTKTYDGSLSYTPSNADLTNLSTQLGVSGDTVTAATVAYTDKNAGASNKTVALSALTISDGNGGNNYNITTAGNNTSTITRATLSANLQGTSSKTYDGLTNATLTNSNFHVTGWVLAEGAQVNQTAGTYASKDVADNTAGSKGSVSANLLSSNFTANAGTDLNNYILPSSASGNIGVITPAALTISVNNTSMFVTQNATTALDQGFAYTGLQNGETAATALSGGALTSANRVFTYSTNLPSAGTYNGVYGLNAIPTATHGNYTVTVQNGNLTVVPADKLLITVASQSTNYGAQSASNAGLAGAGTVTAQYCLDATITCSGSNLVSLTTTALTGTHWRASDNTGSYVEFSTGISAGAYSQGGYLNAGNYTFTTSEIAPLSLNNGNFSGRFTNSGVLTVTPLSVSASASGVSKVYDGNTNVTSANVTLSGALTGDDLSVSYASASYSSKNVSSSANFSLSGLSLGGADLLNYALSSNSLNSVGSISAKTLTLNNPVVANKTYDGSTVATVTATGTLSGLIGLETLNITQATGTFASANVGTHLSVNVSASLGNGTQGGLASNYAVSATTTYADITAASAAPAGSSSSANNNNNITPIPAPNTTPSATPSGTSASSGSAGSSKITATAPASSSPTFVPSSLSEKLETESCNAENLTACQCDSQGSSGVSICYQPLPSIARETGPRPSQGI